MRIASRLGTIVTIGAVALLLAVSPASAQAPDFDGNAVRFTVDNAADIGDARPGDGRCEIAAQDSKADKAIVPGPTIPTMTTIPAKGGSAPGRTIPTLYPPITPQEPLDSAGRCTLRAAVEEAGANTKEAHVVTLPSSLGVYHLTEGELIVRGELKVTRDFSPGSKRAAINAGHRSRIFDVYVDGAYLAIDGLFLAQGRAGDSEDCCDGGAIWVDGETEVDINRSVLVHNRGRAGGAVAVSEGGRLTVRSTSFESNHAYHYGGAIRALGSVHLDRVSIYNNTSVLGGGIYLDNQEENGFWMENSSVIDNTATEAGGGIYMRSRAFSGMVHTTVSGNAAPEGGGYYNEWTIERMVMAFSILAGNIDTVNPTGRDASPDCYGGVSTDHVNLFGAIGGFGAGASECWGYDVSEDIIGTNNNPIDPRLESVRISTDANARGDGGELAYRRPGFGSPVLNLISVSRCITGDDMIRSGVRVNGNCDLGAIER